MPLSNTLQEISTALVKIARAKLISDYKTERKNAISFLYLPVTGTYLGNAGICVCVSSFS